MKTAAKCFLLICAVAVSGAAQSSQTPPPAAPSALAQVIDRIITQENQLSKSLARYHPLVETYIQHVKPDRELGAVPEKDEYFLGKLNLAGGIDDHSLLSAPGLPAKSLKFFNRFFSIRFLPSGFAQMALVDEAGFDRQHYDFEYVRREFLGEVRTLVFDVKPKKGSGAGRFVGRVWAEDQDYHIVRFNGTYGPTTSYRHYFHFDSWRVNMGPNLWLPAYVYTEESDFRYLKFRSLRFKGQTRIWGYDLKQGNREEEFTKIVVDAQNPVRDQSDTPADLAPVRSLRAWERLAEDNVLQRLEKAGLLAPEGEVDRILTTVINNIEVTNNIDIQPEVRARVLLTTPLESFTVGHTIVISRGLLDVLPDEASLAMVLSHELGHILLGHRLDTKFAFDDRMLFADEQTFKRLGFRHDTRDEAAADQKALALLENSPYKGKTATAGLFLKALSAHAGELPALIRPHMGNRMADGKTVSRMAQLMNSAPQLETARKEQIAALPLGGRVKVDPWSCRVMMLRNKPVALLSAREKMSFEVTPFLPYLTRQSTTEQVAAAGAGANTGATTGNGGGAADQPKTSGVDDSSQGSAETATAVTEAKPATPAAAPKQ
jgi:hypothetical protein